MSQTVHKHMSQCLVLRYHSVPWTHHWRPPLPEILHRIPTQLCWGPIIKRIWYNMNLWKKVSSNINRLNTLTVFYSIKALLLCVLAHDRLLFPILTSLNFSGDLSPRRFLIPSNAFSRLLSRNCFSWSHRHRLYRKVGFLLKSVGNS